tara:strand:+ start:2591 stop:2896 length:306 start_codon:yes stop_codon:yes gene_type:complete
MAGRTPLNHEAVTVAASAIGFDATTATNNGIRPNAALITVETAEMRFTTDGTTPTTTVGHLADAGQVIELSDRTECEQFRAIRTGSSSSEIMVTTFAEWAF